jgi:hypothetical protein
MAYRMGLQPTAHPNSGISQSSGYSIGQRIRPEHLRQKPNPFGIAYAGTSGYGALASDYSGCGCSSAKSSPPSHHLIDKQTVMLLLLAFGIGYLISRK